MRIIFNSEQKTILAGLSSYPIRGFLRHTIFLEDRDLYFVNGMGNILLNFKNFLKEKVKTFVCFRTDFYDGEDELLIEGDYLIFKKTEKSKIVKEKKFLSNSLSINYYTEFKKNLIGSEKIRVIDLRGVRVRDILKKDIIYFSIKNKTFYQKDIFNGIEYKVILEDEKELFDNSKQLLQDDFFDKRDFAFFTEEFIYLNDKLKVDILEVFETPKGAVKLKSSLNPNFEGFLGSFIYEE